MDALGSYLTGDYALMSREQARRYNEAGHTVSDLERRTLSFESVSVDPSGIQATVISCEIDASVRYDAAGQIVNDEFQSVRRASILLAEGGMWRIAAFENLEASTSEEGNVCVS